MTIDVLPSWNDGATKQALVDFLAAARDVPVDERVAVLDNDGTLWCEKPNYPQLEFLLGELARAVGADPSLARREEYRALIEGDTVANDVWIGANAIILPGVKVGDGAVIGAGAVVTKDVEAFQIVAGVPAKPVRKRFAEPLCTALADSKWWDLDYSELKPFIRRIYAP